MITGRWVYVVGDMCRPLYRWVKFNILRHVLIAEAFASLWEQEQMLVDRSRCEAFREALTMVVRPGDLVLDLGTGTGLLAMFAVKAGARHVYAIEMSRIADMAVKLIRANGMQDKITILRGNSMNARVPERCDVMVSELLSVLGFENEGIIEYFEDARRRMLKPGARIIPESCQTLLMPVHTDEVGVGHVSPRIYDLDYQPFCAERKKIRRYVEASGKKIIKLAEPVRCWPLNFLQENKIPGLTTLEFTAIRDGRLDGFLGWFESVLAPRVTLSNSPDLPLTSWRQLYFPVFEQPMLRRGQSFELEIDPNMVNAEARWKYRVILGAAASAGASA